MKRWVKIIGTGALLLTVCIAGTGIWVKANLQEIVRDLTGKDIRFSAIDVSYGPTPFIVLNDLSVREGSNAIDVPQLKLYPDLKGIATGEISIKKAVLEDPVIVAAKEFDKPEPNHGEPKSAAMGAIPEGQVVLNRAKFILQTAQGDKVQASVSAHARKSGQRIAIDLKNATIDEIGLNFSGQVGIESFAPLKLSVNAQKGSFNPDAVKAFLLNFGYITKADANRAPEIGRIDAKGLTVDFDAATGHIQLGAKDVDIDTVKLSGVSLNLATDGPFSLGCTSGALDTKSIFKWFQQSSDGQKIVSALLAQAKLKTIAPKGVINISAFNLRADSTSGGAQQAVAPLEGEVELDGRNMEIHLVAENDQEQSFTISELRSKVTIEKGRPTVKLDKFTFNSSLGGSGHISGHVPLPIDFNRSELNTTIHDLKVFNSTLDVELRKDRNARATFDVMLDAPNLGLDANGLFYCPNQKEEDIVVKLGSLRITRRNSNAESETTALDHPIDTRAITGSNLSARVFVNAFHYEGLPRIQDVDLHFKSANHRADLHGSMQLGGVNFTLGAAGIPPDQVVATLETKGTDIDLTALIGCFSSELPVYLSGRLYLTGSFGVNGKTPRELIDGAQGEMTLVMNHGKIKRLSGLDPRLGFFLDITRAAGIRTHKLDTITISKGVINWHLQKDRLILNDFSLVGPLLSAWGNGEFALADHHLTLSGGVKTALGVKRRLNIDRVLGKEKT